MKDERFPKILFISLKLKDLQWNNIHDILYMCVYERSIIFYFAPM